MKISTKTRIALIFVVIALVTGVIIGLIVNSVITYRVIHETQERIQEALNTARWVYSSKINDIDRTIYLTSIRYVLRDVLKKENVLSIKDEMTKLMTDYGLDFLTLVDPKGKVFLRLHNPGISGDSLKIHLSGRLFEAGELQEPRCFRGRNC